MTNSYDNEQAVAIDAVRVAARVCQSVQSAINPNVMDKKDRSPVTVADFSSQAVICRTLAELFPDNAIIAEEDAAELRKPENRSFLERIDSELQKVGIVADENSICEWIDRGQTQQFQPRFWTLDPIDGTKGFLRGEQYAISLALIVDGQIEVAILGCPNLPITVGESHSSGAIFSAIRGQGSSVTSLQEAAASQPVRVSTTTEMANARFCESVESGHSSHNQSAEIAEKLGITQPPVRLDSQAKYAIVARGEADIYLRLPTRADYTEKIWDHAGGVLIVEEAGGTVTDIAGKPLEFTHGRELTANRGVVVTNGRLHDPVLDAVKSVVDGPN